jgi:hypothetical protein
MAYDYHKEAKASRAKKLKSYKSADPHQKVDSSDWTPAEPLNTEAKTGMRPVSRRQFKRGGKVLHKIEGAHTKTRHDRKARKHGGKADGMPTVDRFINKDMKKANEYRDGEKHVGGMKKGGRAGKLSGGALEKYLSAAYDDKDDTENAMVGRFSRKDPRDAAYIKRGDERIEKRKRGIKMAESKLGDKGLMNKGGRAHKDMGGGLNAMDPIMMAGNRLNSMNASGNTGVSGITPGMPTGAAGKSIMRMKGLGMKKGGHVDHPDEKADKQLIKKMIKPSAMKREEHCGGGMAMPKKRAGGSVFSGNSKEKIPGATGGRKARADGGNNGGMRSERTDYEKARRNVVDEGMDLDTDSQHTQDTLRKAVRNFENTAKETGYSNLKRGGRTKHASGGKVGKGKTNINIVIAPHGGHPQDQQAPAGGMMPPQPMPMPNKPPMGGMPMGGMPMGMDPNLALLAAKNGGAGAPPAPPPMPMPMGRKTGGRVHTTHVIDNAAGGGLGRLEKIKAYGHMAH